MFGIFGLLLPENCNDRCVSATIINRAYYSAYSYCKLWLFLKQGFTIKHPWEFKKSEKRKGEHKQIRDALYDFGEETMGSELRNLAILRNKADYNIYSEITDDDLCNAINHMKCIFNHLKLD